MRDSSLNIFRLVGHVVWPVKMQFGGGGGGSAPPPPPAPPAPPPPAAATVTSRSLLTRMLPRRTRGSTLLTQGGPATSGTTGRNILGTPLT